MYSNCPVKNCIKVGKFTYNLLMRLVVVTVALMLFPRGLPIFYHIPVNTTPFHDSFLVYHCRRSSIYRKSRSSWSYS